MVLLVDQRLWYYWWIKGFEGEGVKGEGVIGGSKVMVLLVDQRV